MKQHAPTIGSHFYEKLQQAIASAMFAKTDEQVMSVLVTLRRAETTLEVEMRGILRGVFADADNRKLLGRIQDAYRLRPGDATDLDRARGMTRDEKHTLAHAMLNLARRIEGASRA